MRLRRSLRSRKNIFSVDLESMERENRFDRTFLNEAPFVDLLVYRTCLGSTYMAVKHIQSHIALFGVFHYKWPELLYSML